MASLSAALGEGRPRGRAASYVAQNGPKVEGKVAISASCVKKSPKK